MSLILEGGPPLSFSSRVSRLGLRLKDPEWRRYGLTLIAGKFLGLALLFAVIVAFAVIPSLLSGSVQRTGHSSQHRARPGNDR